MTNRELAADLRQAVREYRDPSTTDAERAELKAYFQQHGAANHCAAVVVAAELEKEG